MLRRIAALAALICGKALAFPVAIEEISGGYAASVEAPPSTLDEPA